MKAKRLGGRGGRKVREHYVTHFGLGLRIELGRYVEANGRFAQRWDANWSGFGGYEN
jgi:hypothetical protein